MRVISLNMNGIRAAERKGFFEWLVKQNADLVCLQEVRIQEHQLTEQMKSPSPLKAHYLLAEKPGYSGVAMYFRQPPLTITEGLGWTPADKEGRFLCAEYDQLAIASVYLPSGSSSEERQKFKYQFMDHLALWMDQRKSQGKEVLICGDLNIAHTKLDLKNWRGNQKNSGFLPAERAWFDGRFIGGNWVDVFRHLHPLEEGKGYTWWSNRGNAWANNTGWRIDYQLGTPGIAATAELSKVYKDDRFSDHAPLCVDYSFQI